MTTKRAGNTKDPLDGHFLVHCRHFHHKKCHRGREPEVVGGPCDFGVNLPEMEINEELMRLLPPLSDAERAALEEDILIYGGARDRLVVIMSDMGKSREILLDGHNRYSICRRHALLFDTVSAGDNIKTIEEAKEWIIKNQLGRRNLTDARREEYIGLLYKHEKKAVGNPDAKNPENGQYVAKNQCGQNVHIDNNANLGGKESRAQDVPLIVLATKRAAESKNGQNDAKNQLAQNEQFDNSAKKSTADKVAKEQGVSRETVKRAEKFADAISRIEKVSPEAAEKIRADKSVIPRGGVRALADAPEEVIKKAAQAIVEDKPAAPKPKPAPPAVSKPLEMVVKGESGKWIIKKGHIDEAIDELLEKRGIDWTLSRLDELLRPTGGDIDAVFDGLANNCEDIEYYISDSKRTVSEIEYVLGNLKGAINRLNNVHRRSVVELEKRGGGSGDGAAPKANITK